MCVLINIYTFSELVVRNFLLWFALVIFVLKNLGDSRVRGGKFDLPSRNKVKFSNFTPNIRVKNK